MYETADYLSEMLIPSRNIDIQSDILQDFPLADDGVKPHCYDCELRRRASVMRLPVAQTLGATRSFRYL